MQGLPPSPMQQTMMPAMLTNTFFQPEPNLETSESLPWQCLSEPVGQLFRCRHIAEIHFAGGLLFPHEMVLDIDVLGAAMLSRVLGKSERSLIISIDDSGIRFPLIHQLIEEPAEPHGFLSCLCLALVFCFAGRKGDGGLALR